MRHSLRSLEGYLLVDNRLSGGSVFESPTITCKHCQRIVVLNPNRTRSRGYCPSCNGYVCDTCEAIRVQTGDCKSFERLAEKIQEAGVKGIIHG